MNDYVPEEDSIGKNTGGWLDSLGSRVLVGKIYFEVLKKIDLDDS